MTGDLGIWQHATEAVPNEAFGYCVDDVARALLVDLAHARVLGWDAVSSSAWQSLRFMRDAFDPVSGRFRNFRDADGTWLDATGSEDSHGRALLTLGVAVRDHPEAEFGANARMLFGVALPAASHLHALRATASTVLGCAAALDRPGRIRSARRRHRRAGEAPPRASATPSRPRRATGTGHGRSRSSPTRTRCSRGR